MISEELLSEVLNESRVILDYEVSICGKEIHYGHTDIDEDGFINIYELAHKCKEWAKNKGYLLLSGYDDGKTFYCTCSNKSSPDSYSGTEPEAIFKACQWILDNKETK